MYSGWSSSSSKFRCSFVGAPLATLVKQGVRTAEIPRTSQSETRNISAPLLFFFNFGVQYLTLSLGYE